VPPYWPGGQSINRELWRSAGHCSCRLLLAEEEANPQSRQRTDRTGEESDGKPRRPNVGRVAPTETRCETEDAPNDRGVPPEDSALPAFAKEVRNAKIVFHEKVPWRSH
jgi:hypothetical protein